MYIFSAASVFVLHKQYYPEIVGQTPLSNLSGVLHAYLIVAYDLAHWVVLLHYPILTAFILILLAAESCEHDAVATRYPLT